MRILVTFSWSVTIEAFPWRLSYLFFEAANFSSKETNFSSSVFNSVLAFYLCLSKAETVFIFTGADLGSLAGENAFTVVISPLLLCIP